VVFVHCLCPPTFVIFLLFRPDSDRAVADFCDVTFFSFLRMFFLQRSGGRAMYNLPPLCAVRNPFVVTTAHAVTDRGWSSCTLCLILPGSKGYAYTSVSF